MQFKIGNALIPTPKLPVITNTTQPGVPVKKGPTVVPIGHSVVGGLGNNEQRKTVGTTKMAVAQMAGTGARPSLNPIGGPGRQWADQAWKSWTGASPTHRDVINKMEVLQSQGALDHEGRPIRAPGWWANHVGGRWDRLMGRDPDEAWVAGNAQATQMMQSQFDQASNAILSGLKTEDDINALRIKAEAQPFSAEARAYRKAMIETNGKFGQPTNTNTGPWDGQMSSVWNRGIARGRQPTQPAVNVPLGMRKTFVGTAQEQRKTDVAALRAERQQLMAQNVGQRPMYAYSRPMGGTPPQTPVTQPGRTPVPRNQSTTGRTPVPPVDPSRTKQPSRGIV